MFDYLALFASGFVAWVISTLGGGGGALTLVPLVGFIVGAQAVAPVTTLATLIAGSGRLVMFRRDTRWEVVRWGLPGAVLGACAGALVFASLEARWLQIVIGMFLLSLVLQRRFGSRPHAWQVHDWWFFPAHLSVGFVSGLVGAVGPVLNPLYLSAGLSRERLVGTKTAIALPMHCAKLFTYLMLGALSGQLLWFGVAAGVGALVSNWLARRVLRKMDNRTFEAIIYGFMALSGVWMIWQQRQVLAGLWS